MFKYYKENVANLLPTSWVNDILSFSSQNEERVILVANSITSREVNKNEAIETLVVNGMKIKSKIPWLYDLYRGYFFDTAKKIVDGELFVAIDPLYAINLNIQKGANMRYECHVDSNPLQGLLYVTTHNNGDGGELVISNDEYALGTENILKNCQKIYPTSGDLVFFDARKNPHYVEPLKSEHSIRIAVTMNFYTSESPEQMRPIDLNQHLFKTI